MRYSARFHILCQLVKLSILRISKDNFSLTGWFVWIGYFYKHLTYINLINKIFYATLSEKKIFLSKKTYRNYAIATNKKRLPDFATVFFHIFLI